MGADATVGNRRRPRRDAFTWERGGIKSIHSLHHALTCPGAVPGIRVSRHLYPPGIPSDMP